MFSIQVEPAAQVCVLTLRGELDYESAVQLEAAADHVIADAGWPVVVADCAALEFCDSSGIGALVRIYQGLAERGGEFRLAAVPAPVARVFALTGLDQAISLYTTLDAATGAGAPEPAADSDDGQSSLRSTS
ncbi:STAS domain-containing protein [Streptomyces sp. NPDC086783]|uniref:STAS domain-containing protein n=1 Tax=Streptomyces sp. NPDC086783 TaxID=3365758 RepID=UPI003811EB8A